MREIDQQINTINNRNFGSRDFASSPCGKSPYPTTTNSGIIEGQQAYFDFDNQQVFVAIPNKNGHTESKQEKTRQKKTLSRKDEAQQMYHIFDRGINILIPPQATKIIYTSSVTNEMPITEAVRLSRINNCKILKERYPTPEKGIGYMTTVDYQRRNELLQLARNLTSCIVKEWRKIDRHKPIAVILFGSVAKGLVRRGDHPDPSNIDLAVIGEFTEVEMESLFNAISTKRREAQQIILSSCPMIVSKEKNPGNAGVHIQSIKNMKSGDYAGAISHINAGGFAIYDSSNIWQKIEEEALIFMAKRAIDKRGKNKLHNTIFKSLKKCVSSRVKSFA